MSKLMSYTKPWKVLDKYRGAFFDGHWPTLPEMFRITVERFGERSCWTIFDPGKISLTFNEALEKIERIAQWLREAGIQKGDKIAVTGKNSPEWIVAYMAALFAGAIIVPIDVQLKQEEVNLLIKTADVRMIFTDDEKIDYFNDNLGSDNNPIEHIISLTAGKGTYLYDLEAQTPYSIPQPNEDDTAAILFTSGTTGRPKGVMLSHKNLITDGFAAVAVPFNVSETDVFYAILPLQHAYTAIIVIVAMIFGSEVVFGKRLVVKQIFRDLKEGHVNIMLAVPMLYNKVLAGIMKGLKEKGLLVYGLIRALMALSGLIRRLSGKNPGKKLFGFILDKVSFRNIRVCISGGGSLAASVSKTYNAMGVPFVQGYGLTETSPIITLNPEEHYKEGSVGRVLPMCEMKIINADSNGIGEVVVRGSMVMQGYYKMPEETAAVFTEDGWLKTGDIGYIDNENYLYLTGRAKNIIVTSGGKNVYPEEIENEFQLYEKIEQILVRPFIYDETIKDERIEALIYPAMDYFVNTDKAEIQKVMEEIVNEVNTRLLPYQRIDRVILLEKSMEMTSTKKIKRNSVQGTTY